MISRATMSVGNLATLLFVSLFMFIPVLEDLDEAANEEMLHRSRSANMVERDQYLVSSLAWLVFQLRLFIVPASIVFATGSLFLRNPLTSIT